MGFHLIVIWTNLFWDAWLSSKGWSSVRPYGKTPRSCGTTEYGAEVNNNLCLTSAKALKIGLKPTPRLHKALLLVQFFLRAIVSRLCSHRPLTFGSTASGPLNCTRVGVAFLFYILGVGQEGRFTVPLGFEVEIFPAPVLILLTGIFHLAVDGLPMFGCFIELPFNGKFSVVTHTPHVSSPPHTANMNSLVLISASSTVIPFHH
jgi:hypothetical protein